MKILRIYNECIMTYQEETEMLNYLMETRTSEDYEETGSIIKLYLNIVENNNCKYRPTFAEDILDIAYQSITDFIETTTTDEIDDYGHVDDLLEFNDFSTERKYFKYLQYHRGTLENIMARYNSVELENAVNLWIVQDQLTDELDAFNDELLREIGEKLNILSRYWKEKRNRKRKQLINKLKIHSVEHLVLSYL